MMCRSSPGRSPFWGWLKCGLVILIMAAGLQAAPRAAAAAGATEEQVKAAFLFKFGGYVEWPAQAFLRPDSPLDIGVIGDDGLADELARMAENRAVQGRAVVVRKVAGSDSLDGLHVLFVAERQQHRLAHIRTALRNGTTLIVTEGVPVPDGAMIAFVVIDHKLRFDIALSPAEEAQLKISARLLSVARKVIGRPS